MPDFLRSLWLAARALPLYAGLVLLSLTGFVWAGLHGTRLLGDDNESTETLGSAGRGASGGHARYYHK
ncbi:hypothetical protein [uncultured Hymenobacter sp.]|uniref:hypothetical protein n=1 Tax=uncultured Hymenobacter sp. TaxID=170016 RepID=UPI0035CC6680